MVFAGRHGLVRRGVLSLVALDDAGGAGRRPCPHGSGGGNALDLHRGVCRRLVRLRSPRPRHRADFLRLFRGPGRRCSCRRAHRRPLRVAADVPGHRGGRRFGNIRFADASKRDPEDHCDVAPMATLARRFPRLFRAAGHFRGAGHRLSGFRRAGRVHHLHQL